METLVSVSDQREGEEIDVEADIEHDDTEDEELKFDPDKDLWVSVRVERSGRDRDSVSESSYWVWEVWYGCHHHIFCPKYFKYTAGW